MKKILYTIFFFLFGVALALNAQGKDRYKILLTGASFASPNNGWFELGCEHLNAVSINRAIGAEAIANTANRMIDGTLYSQEELDDIDVFVIMQVHDQDVASEDGIKNNYLDYTTPFDRSNYAAAYDYVIKRYISECYNLKFNKSSKYYGTEAGKPAVIVLCTHWHDARAIYNPAIRKLAQKWGFPVVEFDKYIGFSRNQQHPVTKAQYSILYTDNNTEVIDGVTYGWHPVNGKDKYIQQRMAAIFVDTMKRILPLY